MDQLYKIASIALILLTVRSTPAPVLSGPIMMTLPTSGGGCGNTLQQQHEPTFNSLGDTSGGYTKLSTSFTATNSITVCRIDVYVGKVGTPAGNVKCSIYTTSGGDPAVLVGTSSTSVACTTLSGTVGYFSFTGLSAAITASTVYNVVLEFTSAGTGSNYVQWQYGDITGPKFQWFDSSWHTFGLSNIQGWFKLFN